MYKELYEHGNEETREFPVVLDGEAYTVARTSYSNRIAIWPNAVPTATRHLKRSEVKALIHSLQSALKEPKFNG